MNTETKDEVVYLYLDDIIPNRFQPREVFDEKALKELAVSIKEHGVIQPIIVRSVKDKYEIIAGERRYKASALAGLTKIPAIIRDLDDKESSKVALLENLQRKNLTPIEEARTYQKILEIDEMTQEDLAKTMGKSQSAVANKLRLLTLPDEIQDSLLKEQISERHARALLNLTDVPKQIELLKKIINQKMSVRAVEEEIKRLNNKDGISNMANTSQQITVTPTPINPTPLSPTIMPIEEIVEVEPYEGYKVVPPAEGNTFINYENAADVDEEETEELDEPMNFNNINEPVDINALKKQAEDIKPQETSNNLDSLLNINVPGQKVYNSPAEKAISEGYTPQQPKSKDYFSAPDFSTIDLPTVAEPAVYTVDDAMNKIRDLVRDLESHGISVHKDEMNFERTFQVIIKIDKNVE